MHVVVEVNWNRKCVISKRVNFIFLPPPSFLAVKAVVIFGDLFF